MQQSGWHCRTCGRHAAQCNMCTARLPVHKAASPEQVSKCYRGFEKGYPCSRQMNLVLRLWDPAHGYLMCRRQTEAVLHAIARCYEHWQQQFNPTTVLRVLMIRRFAYRLLLSKGRPALQGMRARQPSELRGLVLGSLVPAVGCVRGLARLVLGIPQPAAVVSQEVAADVGGLLRSASPIVN